MTSKEVDDAAGPYRCPLCKVQTTSDAEDIGWIACPMVDRQMICMGCCFDYAGIALSERFDNHPLIEDFRKLSLQTSVGLNQLRITCLNHQLCLYTDEVERAATKEIKEAMLSQLAEVRARLHSLGN